MRHRSLTAFGHFARPHQLTSYDALYLELAVAVGRALCTFDGGLQDAARRLGVAQVIDRQRGQRMTARLPHAPTSRKFKRGISSVHDLCDQGSIVDFRQKHGGGNLGDVRKGPVDRVLH